MNDYERKQAEELAAQRYPYRGKPGEQALAQRAFIEGYGAALEKRMSVQEDIEIIRASMNDTGARMSAWKAMDRLEAALESVASESEEDYEWGTRWPAAEMLTQYPVIYSEKSRQTALETLEDDRVACGLDSPRGELVKRRVRLEGQWEEA